MSAWSGIALRRGHLPLGAADFATIARAMRVRDRALLQLTAV
jgi:hypothetical protein